jgi:hypothetical protein
LALGLSVSEVARELGMLVERVREMEAVMVRSGSERTFAKLVGRKRRP